MSVPVSTPTRPVRTGVPAPSPRTAPRASRPQAPTLQQAAQGHHIRRGQQGDSVQQLQEMLTARGYDLGAADGVLGRRTEAAVRAFQRDQGIAVDGVVGPQTLGALGVPSGASTVERAGQTQARQQAVRTTGADPSVAAPRANTPPPSGGVSAGSLQRQDQAQRQTQAASASRVTTPPAVNGTADARLAGFQNAAVASAQRELDAGVREQGGANRGPRVDQYARTAGMSVGGQWCGYFTGFNYTQAAQEGGTRFSGQQRLHSYQKARDYFLYRNYTNASRSEHDRNAALRTQHEGEGSARRYMTFQGSVGDRYASARSTPHEVYSNPADLPIRPGDTALFARGHVGMVEGYDPASGMLTTVEGNTGNRVQRHTYDLNDPAVRARFDGFGRPASGDFR